MFARAMGWDRSGTYVIPKACVHKLAKMAGVGGDNNDFRLDAESERLGGKDDINVEVKRGRSRAPLLAGLWSPLERQAMSQWLIATTSGEILG